MLLRSYEDETIRRIAAGAIANLAMNGDSFISIPIVPDQNGLLNRSQDWSV